MALVYKRAMPVTTDGSVVRVLNRNRTRVEGAFDGIAGCFGKRLLQIGRDGHAEFRAFCDRCPRGHVV